MSTLDKQPSLSPNTVWRERRAFAYYFQYAAASIGGGLDLDFWRTIVPQVCRNEPAVWDALISIGSLFESPNPCPDLVSRRWYDYRAVNQNQQDALGWYSRAVSAVRQGIERGSIGPFVGLITCVLFICVESLLGSMEQALHLYNQGVQLILTLRAQRACGVVTATEFSLLREIIEPIFVRLAVFSPNSIWELVKILLRETELGLAPAQEFASLKSAREAIVLLATEVPLFELACEEYLQESRAGHISEELMHRRRTLSDRLESWRAAFTQLMESLRSKDGLSSWQGSTGALLLTYYEMLFVILAVCISPSRITTDTYTPNFQNIVEQATVALNGTARCNGTQPPFTFEISIGPPLWFTGLRCREPTIRRTALALLRQAHEVQGLHRRDQGAAVGEKIMMVEEAYATAMNVAENTADFTAAKAKNASIEYQSYCQGNGSPSGALGLDHAAGRTRSPAAMLIPQEARIRPHGIFRPQDGYPPGTTEEDITKWRADSGQIFLQFSWNECDRSSNTWKTSYGYIPIDF